MAKKYVPRLLNARNLTFFISVIISVIIGYMVVEYIRATTVAGASVAASSPNIVIASPSAIAPSPLYSLAGTTAGISTIYNDPMNDPYIPPLKVAGTIFPNIPLGRGADIYGLPAPITTCGAVSCQTRVPVNVQTNAVNMSYTQVGILTKPNHHSPQILPLMGRSLWNRRDKWQYYTMANTAAAAINTKLPVRARGKSCTGEYGCDELYTGDEVFVEGMNDNFVVTIYENAGLAYLPV